MLVVLLLATVTAASEYWHQDFLGQARLFIYKRNLLGAGRWKESSFYQWNSLINVTAKEIPAIESVENLTIVDVPRWIPSDYNPVLHILELFKLPNLLPEDEDNELYDLMENLVNTYITAKVCSYERRKDPSCVPTMKMEEIRNSSETRNKNKLLYYWKEWREKTGKAMRNNYARFIRLKNKESRLNAYTMEEMWLNIEEFSRPYPRKPTLDITNAMRRKNMTARNMAMLADKFFVSIGMNPMTEIFWKESVLEKPTDRLMDCYPVSLDMGVNGAHRIRFCALVRLEDLFVIFHEMGHIQYFRESETQPIVRHRIPNDGLHEAIGGTVALSALNPIYLREIGLLDDFVDSEEQDINFLYMMALMRIASLSHMYMVDKWRWDVFDGTIADSDLNKKWWEYRLKIQGHCPFVRRTEKDFDAGAMYLISRHLPSISYFIAGILEFQFHKTLCDAKGHVGPLHKCTIRNSTAAGDRLKAMLRLGSSVSWRSAIYNITGGETDRVSAKPLLQFFQPLLDWLIDQNKDAPIGWEGCDPTICS